jgi:adenosyl cobinamide kinase/adenosyl cobinamide phosphate guanylyltransferase
MGQLIVIVGGARSGKSTYAQELAQTIAGEQVLFVATAEAGDADMAQRISKHRQSRPAVWHTLEIPRHVGHAIPQHIGEARVVLVDCLTLLVSNALLALPEPLDSEAATMAMQDEVAALLQACHYSTATFIVVSNEVGLGLVPDNALGRLYRDLLGYANQAIARQANAVYFMVAGMAIDVKKLAEKRSPAHYG